MDYTMFFNKQLTVVLKKVIETIYTNTKFNQYLPVAAPEGPGVTNLEWYAFTDVGIAKIISDYATDIPTTESYGTVHTATVRHVGASYRYSLFDVEKAKRAGVDLNARKATSCSRTIDRAIDDIAWNGDANFNIPGFLNASGISEYAVTADGTDTSKLWSHKTPAQILRDLTGLLNYIPASTNDIEHPNTVLMPLTAYQLITTTYLDTTTYSKTIFDAIKITFPNITTWGVLDQLDTAGAEGKARIIAYDKNPDKVEVHVPVRVRQLPYAQNGLGFQVPMSADIAGTFVYYPQSVCFADGI